jgi:hypothetical protein
MSHAQQSVDIQGWVNLSLLLTALLCCMPAALVSNTAQETFISAHYLNCRASLLHPCLHVGCSLAAAPGSGTYTVSCIQDWQLDS